MSAYLCPLFTLPEVDANGSPLAGGQIFTYVAGSVSTPATTYTDSTGTIPQANPIILNVRGVPDNPIWLTGGLAYKLVLKDVLNNTLAPTFDNVSGVNDPTAVTVQDQWVAFTGAPTFLSATTFSVVGDQTPILQVGRRVKTTNSGGVVYSTITASVFGSGVTTVTLLNDASTLDAGLSAVAYGLLSYTNRSVPRQPGDLIGVQRISATGTYTPTPGTNSVIVHLVGSGGAGGGCAATGASQIAAGTGGGAGGYSQSRLTTGFAGVTVTIGAAGVPASGAAGGNGGASSFGAVFSASGGPGGNAGSAQVNTSTVIIAGPTGGTGASGTLVNAVGGAGENAFYLGGASLGGGGGISFYGAGGGRASGSTPGVAGVSPGSGGGGSSLSASAAANAGGAGAAGLCIIWEYA